MFKKVKNKSSRQITFSPQFRCVNFHSLGPQATAFLFNIGRDADEANKTFGWQRGNWMQTSPPGIPNLYFPLSMERGSCPCLGGGESNIVYLHSETLGR